MNLNVQTTEVSGQRMVMLPEREFAELMERAGLPTPELGLPALPKKQGGGYPALEYAAVSIARKIIRARQRLSLTQAELARRAGLAIPFLNRLERGNGNPTIATIDKIDRALRAAEREAQRAGKPKRLP